MNAQTLYLQNGTGGIGNNTSNSNVGIGTDIPAPSNKLEVRCDGITDWSGRLSFSNYTADRQVFLGTHNGHAGVFAHNFALNAWKPLYLNTVTGTSGMVILGDGNVGIGTDIPVSLLTLRNSSLADDATTGNVDLTFATTASGYGTKISTYKETFNTSGLAFYTQYGYGSPVEKMRITATGLVGIGITPVSLLTLRNSSLADDAISGNVDLTFATTASGYGTKISTYKETFNTAGLAFYTQCGYATSVEKMRITATGLVGIGTTNPAYMLDVLGTIRAKEVKVDLNGTADFVFDSNYKLRPLSEVEKYVKEHKHLQEIPSAKEVEQNGVSLGEMQNKLLQKVEELTLYVIEQNKKIEDQSEEIKELKKSLLKK